MEKSRVYFTGRANYLSFRQDLFNVVYVPYSGASAFIIARNLDKQTALMMVEDINEVISNARKAVEASGQQSEEE